jgi:hypothetical protein
MVVDISLYTVNKQLSSATSITNSCTMIISTDFTLDFIIVLCVTFIFKFLFGPVKRFIVLHSVRILSF